MLLGNLLKSINKKYQKIQVSGISFDSRKVKKNNIFFAITGKQTSSFKFIEEAQLKGAAVIVTDEKKIYKKNIKPIILVKNVRKSLAEACSNFYKKKPKNIVAVTGTNGKSSVADFFYQILNFNKISVGEIGTLGVISKKYKKKTTLTSSDPLSLHKNLQILAKNKVNHLILEASSHGLSQKRLDYLNIKVGIFTNLSHDHLDYHKNMNSYLSSKMHLFKNLLNKNSKIITDEDTKEFNIIKNIALRRNIKIMTIGSSSKNVKILSIKYNNEKQVVKILYNLKVYYFTIPLIGCFQIKNLFMAILAALSLNVKFNQIFNHIHKIKPVPGRLELVENLNNNSNIIIDFAHTPDALEQSLIALKKQFKKEIIIVFGCGGDRDKEKRIKMGKIASKHCRKIFITDDNPRNEKPKKIRDTIIKGCQSNAVDIGNRNKAIRHAIKALRSNEILLIAGKGHEKFQDYGNKIVKFSDKKAVREIIKKNKTLHKIKSDMKSSREDTKSNNSLLSLEYNQVSINSKKIKKNDLFFAIKGKKNDGHYFVNEALKNGAIKSVISRKIKKIPNKKIIEVKNTFFSLNHLAKFTRHNSQTKIIGITGSTGKTTLKNLLGFILTSYGKVYHSPYSYNNKFGVPLSVCNLKTDTNFGVFEIGMDKKGEIDNLSKIVNPELAIITNVSEAHLKNFKNIRNIAKAKAEIINNISKGGNIILNKDDKFFEYFSSIAIKKEIHVTSFSQKGKANIFLSGIKKIKNFYRLKISVNKSFFYFDAAYNTYSFISNILACLSVLVVLKLNFNKIEKKFTRFILPQGRGDVTTIKIHRKKFKFIDESYNANPLSMLSAIQNIDLYKTKNNEKKLVLLGDMLELGKKSKKLHRQISNLINNSNIDKVFVYGNHIKETFKHLRESKKGKIFNNLKQAHDHLNKILHNNDLLMIKGSNATGLNKVSKNIKKVQTSVI